MSEGIDGLDNIKDLFETILGSDVIVKDSMDVNEQIVFIVFIERLEEAFKVEEQIFRSSGIELGSVTEPLWFVLENSFKLLYGEEATNLVWWWIFDRIDEDGDIHPYIDEDDRELNFTDTQELWLYINHRFPKDFNEI